MAMPILRYGMMAILMVACVPSAHATRIPDRDLDNLQKQCMTTTEAIKEFSSTSKQRYCRCMRDKLRDGYTLEAARAFGTIDSDPRVQDMEKACLQSSMGAEPIQPALLDRIYKQCVEEGTEKVKLPQNLTQKYCTCARTYMQGNWSMETGMYIQDVMTDPRSQPIVTSCMRQALRNTPLPQDTLDGIHDKCMATAQTYRNISYQQMMGYCDCIKTNIAKSATYEMYVMSKQQFSTMTSSLQKQCSVYLARR